MTSVNNLSHNAINPQSLMNPNAMRGNDGDGDGRGSTGGVQSQGANLFQSVQQSLSQLTSSNSNPSDANNASQQDTQMAIQMFIHSLLTALHQAGNGSASSHQADTDGDNDGSKGKGSAAQAVQYQPNIQADIQTLMKQVSSSSSSNTILQQSHQNMLSALGANGASNNRLDNFLQSLAANMQGSSLVSTKA